MRFWAAITVTVVASIAWADGLSGLGLGVNTRKVEGDVSVFLRQRHPGVTLDMGLSFFARREAAMAAKGDPRVKGVHGRIKKQKLAPAGYYIQFIYGADAEELAGKILQDDGAKPFLALPSVRVGVGVFHVPEEPPYFQAAVLLIQPKVATGPGLTHRQTQPVLDGAGPKIKACYDQALLKDPNLRGRAKVELRVAGTGAVHLARFLKGVEPTLDRCVLGVLQALVFPKPTDGQTVTVHHPVQFEPPNGGVRVGRLQPSQIESTFGAKAAAFKACYDKRRKKKPELAGTLQVNVMVDGRGRVKDVAISGGIPDRGLRRCVKARVMSLSFPKPQFGGQVEFIYPLNFSPPAE